jgi:hypothetical protein
VAPVTASGTGRDTVADPDRRPSATEFVALFESGEVARRARLPASQECRPLESDDSVLLVRLEDSERDPREAWREVRQAMPDATVAPVLVDRAGNRLYPTGTIQVRFIEERSDDEISRFAERFGLANIVRNRYSKAQLSCEPDHRRDRYLPDVINEIGDAPEVRRAWAETKAVYRRL